MEFRCCACVQPWGSPAVWESLQPRDVLLVDTICTQNSTWAPPFLPREQACFAGRGLQLLPDVPFWLQLCQVS